MIDSDRRRIENLESVVRALRDDLSALRDELRALRAEGAPGGELAGDRRTLAAGAPPRFHDAASVADARHPGAANWTTTPPPHHAALGPPPRAQHHPTAHSARHHNDAPAIDPSLADAPPTGVPPGGEPSFTAPGPGHPPPPGPDRPGRFDPPWAAAARAGRSGRPALEAWIGRYGTLALGALALVMALGAWLSWAIENYSLGDTARVALGAVAAAAVAGVGLWLRRRGTRRFGNVLLGIALALLHVDAWGAGPVLGIVPTPIALGAAAVASAALALLAYRSHEQSLFVIGIGGALAAPFVTSDGGGNTLLLLLYGWLVLGAAIYALRSRPWPVAERLVWLGTLVYAGAGAVRNPPPGAAWFVRDAPLFFALNVAATAWAAELAPRQGRLARLLLYVAAVPACFYYDRPTVAVDRVALAFAGTVLAYLAVREAGRAERALFDRFLLPLVFLGAAIASVVDGHPVPTLAGAAVAVLWAGAAAASALSLPIGARERGVDLAVAGLASLVALPVGLGGEGSVAPVAVAAHAALVALLLRRERQLTVGIPVVVGLAIAATWSHLLLDGRTPYAYVPFLTTASVAAAAAVAACAIASSVVTRPPVRSLLGSDPFVLGLAGSIGPVAAFVWGNEELAYAGSPSVASFAIIAYWAATGLLAIFVGRRRGVAAARQVGLGLSILAAFKALARASDQPSIALRIGSYLVVGVFLLAVAYWYRAAGADPVARAEGEPVPDPVGMADAPPLAPDRSGAA